MGHVSPMGRPRKPGRNEEMRSCDVESGNRVLTHIALTATMVLINKTHLPRIQRDAFQRPHSQETYR
jgi:hypothetical protein